MASCRGGPQHSRAFSGVIEQQGLTRTGLLPQSTFLSMIFSENRFTLFRIML
jgi:hypothetical protein